MPSVYSKEALPAFYMVQLLETEVWGSQFRVTKLVADRAVNGARPGACGSGGRLPDSGLLF